MRIFYAIQGTGNGHITRGRAMATELAKAGCEVTYLFSGREREKLFEMDVFGDYQWRDGLTFHTEKGHVCYIKTAFEAKPLVFIRDVRSLDLSSYDLVLCDFEPVTAWAAKLRGAPCIGIGHQYAFNYAIPKAGYDPISAPVMKFFAPVSTGIGLHWHHFGQPILPPIFEPAPPTKRIKENKIIVYLPFEQPEQIVTLLKPFTSFEFHVYSPVPLLSDAEHIHVKPLSRQEFQKDFSDAAGIISNAGFELISEALLAGKKILVKPLQRQLEQISNALALRELNYGTAAEELTQFAIADWLSSAHAVRVSYPNVAAALVQRLHEGREGLHDPEWMAELWRGVTATPAGIQ